jgi:hypothetical protein
MKTRNNNSRPASQGGQPPVPNRNGSSAPAAAAAPLNWERLTTMDDTEVFGLAKASVARHRAIEDAERDATKNIHLDAKVAAACKRIYTLRISKHSIPGDTKFNDFFRQNVGGELPGRVASIANVFNALVEVTPQLLSEAKFDAMPADALEKAAPIIAEARKKDGDKYAENPFVQRVCKALNEPPPEGCAKAIKTVREDQTDKPKKGDAPKGAETPGALPGDFGPTTITHVVRQAALRQMLPQLLREVGAELASAKGSVEYLLQTLDALQLTVDLAQGNPAMAAAFETREAAQSPGTPSGPASTEPAALPAS